MRGQKIDREATVDGYFTDEKLRANRERGCVFN